MLVVPPTELSLGNPLKSKAVYFSLLLQKIHFLKSMRPGEGSVLLNMRASKNSHVTLQTSRMKSMIVAKTCIFLRALASHSPTS